MRSFIGMSIVFCLVIGASAAYGQPSDITVSELTLPEVWRWGNQTLGVTVTNNTEIVKFIVVKTRLEFVGAARPSRRETRTSPYLEPGATVTLRPILNIPGNYGNAVARMMMYDVVDTLDAILSGDEFFDTTFSLSIEMPPSAQEWVNRPIVLSPRVEQHPYFDDQYTRILLQLIDEGKSEEEVSAITGAEPVHVLASFRRMRRHGYFVRDSLGNGHRLTFPVVSRQQAEKAAQLTDQTAQQLADLIAANFGQYEALRDSLFETGAVKADPNDVLGSARILYRPYAIVSTLLLWHELGSKFVTGGGVLMPFENTDICNANNPNYTYAAPEGEQYNGHHFYACLSGEGSYSIEWADRTPSIKCSGNFPAKPGTRTPARWTKSPDDQSEFYCLDTAATRPLLDLLARGTDDVLQTALAELGTLVATDEHPEPVIGHKYYYWNLIASKTLDILTEQNAIGDRGLGYFSLVPLRGL